MTYSYTEQEISGRLIDAGWIVRLGDALFSWQCRACEAGIELVFRSSEQVSAHVRQAHGPEFNTAVFGRPDAIAEFKGKYRFLSNFHVDQRFDVVVRGRNTRALSGEHAYQACKAVHDSDAARILDATTPGKAKRLGRRAEMRGDWDAVKVAVMRHVLEAKFAPDSALAAELVATGDAILVEGNTWNDTFWGVASVGRENWLGYLLMARRSELHLGRAYGPGEREVAT